MLAIPNQRREDNKTPAFAFLDLKPNSANAVCEDMMKGQIYKSQSHGGSIKRERTKSEKGGLEGGGGDERRNGGDKAHLRPLARMEVKGVFTSGSTTGKKGENESPMRCL